uniref:Uncharacterized protein n=1 Tax=Anguilla anguilla TaxID=7936 RepID=A0A0E9WTU6_ANGAN
MTKKKKRKEEKKKYLTARILSFFIFIFKFPICRKALHH